MRCPHFDPEKDYPVWDYQNRQFVKLCPECFKKWWEEE